MTKDEKLDKLQRYTNGLRELDSLIIRAHPSGVIRISYKSDIRGGTSMESPLPPYEELERTCLELENGIRKAVEPLQISLVNLVIDGVRELEISESKESNPEEETVTPLEELEFVVERSRKGGKLTVGDLIARLKLLPQSGVLVGDCTIRVIQ